ncbi:hypothetical protein SAMN04487996_11911 [Dyadobacter soli]|uniref:DUF4175 domain-containing protein n=1 Tax=Dyadobacter soli TaxID=659014 RepID=A0A1G7UJJ5_9BACT|nr:hypothetical protein [Dyadobacter soli]SDG47249.1 hypothetical protein SAMN04487996_11911 [Dyadobacter soli]
MADLQKLIKSVNTQIQWVAIGKCLLLGLAFRLVAISLPGEHLFLESMIGSVGTLIGIFRTKAFTDRKRKAIALLHSHNPGLEYSLDLLDKPDLNLAEQMQLERIAARDASAPRREVYRGLWAYFGIFLLGWAINHGVYLWSSHPEAPANAAKQPSILNQNSPPKAPRYVDAHVKVTPPAYTGLPAKTSADLNISALSGSAVEWSVEFDRPAGLSVRMVNSRGEEVALKESNGAFTLRDRIAGSGLYSIKGYWKDSLIYQSDFYKMEALPDLAPRIEPASKELYRYHLLKDPKSISISAKISDDFQVKQAFIVATVARGSGENVKFREVRMPLGPSDFKEANIRKTIDLNALQFAPGDELYYYWAATDNRQPEANFSKSDTYFVVYKDTAKIEEAELATMAVNVMPEYFRSQRQIIIDTEKLIAKRKKLGTKDFNATSNEIGFDQKVLRLRYGQYLGEEFETAIGGDNPAADNGNVIDAFTHHSDGHGEGASPAERGSADAGEPAHAEGHAHEHKHEPAGEKDPLAALMEQYTHAHDDAETNTFYEQSTRSLLKMALEQMWQSELHLRTYEPEKALPFEHKALEYLKTAQQKARTYVKKSGYDPPPIKEKEKRLTGELKDLSTQWEYEKAFNAKQTAALAAALLGYLENDKLPKSEQAKRAALSSEMTRRLTESGPFNGGLQNWNMIASLQKLAVGRALNGVELAGLKRDLYKRTDAAMQSRPSWSGEKKLEAAFRKAMRQPL